MLYVIVLRYSETDFSRDVSSVEHVLRNEFPQLNMYYAMKIKGLAQ